MAEIVVEKVAPVAVGRGGERLLAEAGGAIDAGNLLGRARCQRRISGRRKYRVA